MWHNSVKQLFKKSLKNQLSIMEARKVTMVIMNTLGVVVVRHATMTHLGIGTSYQGSYEYKLNVFSQERGKRKTVGYAYDQIAIFDGWQDIINVNPSVIIGAEFSNRKFEAAKSNFKNLLIDFNSKIHSRSCSLADESGNQFVVIGYKETNSDASLVLRGKDERRTINVTELINYKKYEYV